MSASVLSWCPDQFGGHLCWTPVRVESQAPDSVGSARLSRLRQNALRHSDDLIPAASGPSLVAFPNRPLRLHEDRLRNVWKGRAAPTAAQWGSGCSDRAARWAWATRLCEPVHRPPCDRFPGPPLLSVRPPPPVGLEAPAPSWSWQLPNPAWRRAERLGHQGGTPMDAARGRPRRLVGAKCDLPSNSVDDAHSGSSA